MVVQKILEMLSSNPYIFKDIFRIFGSNQIIVYSKETSRIPDSQRGKMSNISVSEKFVFFHRGDTTDQNAP